MKHRLAAKLRVISKNIWLALGALLLITAHVGAEGLSAAQRAVFDSHIYYFNVDDGGGCSVGVTIGPGTLPTIIPEPYNGAFTAAAQAYNVSPLLIAAIFTEEHFTGQDTGSLAASWANLPKVQPDPNSGWATSPDDAMGPFQFIPSTWASLGIDADHNGTKDVENLLDASFGAANYMATDGATADKPESVWHDFADGYSGRTGGYADKVIQYVDFYKTGGSAASGGSTGGVSTSNTGCSGPGAVAGNLAQTAVNFAWDDYPTHGFTSKDPKPSYLAAKNKVHGEGDNVPDEAALTDCGVFIATVVISSGVDANWPQLTSWVMLDYAKSHPDKYTVLPSFRDTKDLQIGDILANTDHIYMYVGQQGDGKSVAEASHFDHVPEIDADPYPSQDNENFSVIRAIK